MSVSRSVALSAGVLGFAATFAGAAPIALFNTGVDDTGAALADGATDTHYVLTANADNSAVSTAIVEDSTAFPIVKGPWLADTAASKWIGPEFNTSGSSAGTFTYTLTFTLPALADLSTATISGNWAFDDGSDTADKVLLNTTTIETGNAGFASYTPFSASTGFVPGVNTLTFTGTNGGSYTGLRVDGLTGTVSTPEPASIALAALAGVGLLSRRRRIA